MKYFVNSEVVVPVKLSATTLGHTMAQLVEALFYDPEGRGVYSRWCHGIFYSHNHSGRTMVLKSS
jgi:hypothetical protein